MKILAIDSSGMVASVAVMQDEELIAEYTTNYKKTHSQTLLVMLDQVKQMIDLDLNSLDAIAVAAGPGSFTGLRIGSATVKGLGLALKKPIVPVATVDALAYNLYGTDALVCPLMDARRNQVYTGIYQFQKTDTKSGYRMTAIKEQCAVEITEIVEKLNQLGREVIFLGDGVSVYASKIEEMITVPYSFAPASCNRQKASCVAALGQLLYQQGKTQTAMEHAPEYLRLSQAERERNEKEKQN